MEIKTINMKFTKDKFDQLKYKKGELSWENYFLSVAKIKNE